jgi:hypothetical protein
MRFCDNRNCEEPDEPLERISRGSHSDYRIIDGAVICVGCDEAEREEAEWRDINEPDLAESDTVTRILWGR